MTKATDIAEDDRKALAMIRSVENRLVWLATFLVATSKTRHTADAASDADKALDEYQTRFPAFTLNDIPSA